MAYNRDWPVTVRTTWPDLEVRRCGEYLMEPDWDEGFVCSLTVGHTGPHRCEGGVVDVNESTHLDGRKYTWVHEWRYQ